MQALESNYPLKPKESFSLFLSFSDTDRREGGADMTGRPMRFSAFAHIIFQPALSSPTQSSSSSPLVSSWTRQSKTISPRRRRRRRKKNNKKEKKKRIHPNIQIYILMFMYMHWCVSLFLAPRPRQSLVSLAPFS